MNISAELSYYPLRDDHLRIIEDFLVNLRKHKNVTINTNSMSTRVYGEFNEVMDVLRTEIERSFKNEKSMFVMKIYNEDLNKEYHTQGND